MVVQAKQSHRDIDVQECQSIARRLEQSGYHSKSYQRWIRALDCAYFYESIIQNHYSHYDYECFRTCREFRKPTQMHLHVNPSSKRRSRRRRHRLLNWQFKEIAIVMGGLAVRMRAGYSATRTRICGQQLSLDRTSCVGLAICCASHVSDKHI